MYACVMDRQGEILVWRNIRRNDFDYFLSLVGPYKHDMTLCCECTFNWYWLSDACEDAGIEFVLSHALYLRSIHMDKKKNDREDSRKIADLLRTNMIPYSYVYPRHMRPLRTLLRTRMNYVWQRSELLAKQTCRLMAEGKTLSKVPQRPRERWKQAVIELHSDPHLKALVETDCAIIEELDRQIKRVEQIILATTKKRNWQDLHVLLSVPGIGKVLALTILYEIGEISRFPRHQAMASYSRLVKGAVASAGKIQGSRGAKMGNGYLKWAFKECILVAKRSHPEIKAMAQRLEKKHNRQTANAILAHRLGRAIFYMLKHGLAFSMELFSQSKKQAA
jgi:transposase